VITERRSTRQHHGTLTFNVLISLTSVQAMAEGGHDPEFDLPRSEDEATPEFASLHDLERHLLSTPDGTTTATATEQVQ